MGRGSSCCSSCCSCSKEEAADCATSAGSSHLPGRGSRDERHVVHHLGHLLHLLFLLQLVKLKRAVELQLQQPELGVADPGGLPGAADHRHAHPEHHHLRPECPGCSAAEAAAWLCPPRSPPRPSPPRPRQA